MKVTAVSGKRFAMVQNARLNLCTMNAHLDEKNKDRAVTKGEYREMDDDHAKIAGSPNTRKVFVGLGVEDSSKR